MGKVLSWGILIVCIAMGAFFYQRILDAAGWVHLQASERAYAELGADLCRQPLLTVPEYTCTAGELDCYTVGQEAVIRRYEAQARGANEWRAERCLPLL